MCAFKFGANPERVLCCALLQESRGAITLLCRAQKGDNPASQRGEAEEQTERQMVESIGRVVAVRSRQWWLCRFAFCRWANVPVVALVLVAPGWASERQTLPDPPIRLFAVCAGRPPPR
uniref:Uncharacterized protein n=1 Tax=Plectus sambesii TaxID=2011161 RepID=A0A914XS90_9BILA